jgi:hypothetical protein
VSVTKVAEHRGKYHVAHHEGCLQESQVLVYKKINLFIKNQYFLHCSGTILLNTGNEATRNSYGIFCETLHSVINICKIQTYKHYARPRAIGTYHRVPTPLPL